jgi:S1-C subfamily serine protease
VDMRSSFTLTQARLLLSTDPQLSESSVLVNDRGVLVALSAADGSVISGAVVRHGLPFVLSKKPITIVSLPYSLSLVTGVQKDDQLLPLVGYLVTKIQPKKPNEVLRVGDIITRVDNKAVDEVVLALLTYDVREQVPLTVYRDGVEVDVVVSLTK